MAYISRGHMPGEDPYGEVLNKARSMKWSPKATATLFVY